PPAEVGPRRRRPEMAFPAPWLAVLWLADGPLVEIDIRAVKRLRESAGARAAIAPMIEALSRSDADLVAMRVVCDWIQYKANFRDTVMVRPVIAPPPVNAVLGSTGTGLAAAAAVEGYELAMDLRRCARPETDVAAEVTAALSDAVHVTGGTGAGAGGPRVDEHSGGALDRVWLEPWVPGSASCVWRFNALYWQALAAWEKSTGKGFEQALPGGESDARNSSAAREVILDLFSSWDELASRRALPEEL